LRLEFTDRIEALRERRGLLHIVHSLGIAGGERHARDALSGLEPQLFQLLRTGSHADLEVQLLGRGVLHDQRPVAATKQLRDLLNHPLENFVKLQRRGQHLAELVER
jgi:hypothetical protein